MNFMLISAGVILYIFVILILIAAGNKKKTDKLGRKVSETQDTLRTLPEKQRNRVEKSLLILEAHPDLRNVLGAPVTKRYADQIAAITQRYAKASENDSTRMTLLLEDGYNHSRAAQDMGDEKSSHQDVLFEEGLGTIERKIEKALALKGAEAKDELDVYVRFLQDAD